MKIEQTVGLSQPVSNHGRAKETSSSNSFSEMMKNSISTEELAAKTNSIGKANSPEKSDGEIIREQGFRAYAEEVRVRKMEELREKILQTMGLSEEDLENMSAEQRMTIEKIVAQEIQRRMEANAEVNNDNQSADTISVESTRAVSNAFGSGGVSGALLAAFESEENLRLEREFGRHQLPGQQEETT